MDFNTERTKLIKEYRNRRIRNAIIGAAIILVLLAVLWNTASVQRFFKSSYSNFTGGSSAICLMVHFMFSPPQLL